MFLEPLAGVFWTPYFYIQMITTLTDLWMSLLITIAILLLFDLILRDERVKDIAFIVFVAWLIVSFIILICHLVGII